jgi:hypothetical protein
VRFRSQPYCSSRPYHSYYEHSPHFDLLNCAANIYTYIWTHAFRFAYAFEATLSGRAFLPSSVSQERHAALSILLTDGAGVMTRTYCNQNGDFSINGLEEGFYLMEVDILGYAFPQYKVEVNHNIHDAVRVTPLNSRVPIEPPVGLLPLGETQYYLKRKPVNIKGFLFSPYGIMIRAHSTFCECMVLLCLQYSIALCTAQRLARSRNVC